MRPWLFLAALNGLTAVAAGAYGTHGLHTDASLKEVFEIGVRYQMWHALALLAVAWLAESGGRRRRPAQIAGIAFTVGIVLFSGTLYVFALTGTLPLAGTAPAGGFALMAGWLALMWAALLRR